MQVSIVVPAYERPNDLRRTLHSIFNQWCSEYEVTIVDDGGIPEIKGVADEFPQAQYYRLDRPGRWKNPGRAMNVGLRLARGVYTIIQHSGIISQGDTTAQIFSALQGKPDTAVLARIMEKGKEVSGSFRPYFLLGGMRTAWFQSLRGYDEDFTEYGYEDDDFALRLVASGITFEHHSDIVAEHAPHDRHDLMGEMERMRRLHYKKIEEVRKGIECSVRNRDREWGSLD